MKIEGWPGALVRPGNRRLGRIEPLCVWYDIYRVSNNTFAILEPRHCEEVISYLITGNDRAVLFDSGMGIADIRAEVERLTNLPIIVVNSHSHYDHIGGNYLFGETWIFDNDFEVARIKRGYRAAECRKYMRPGSYLDLPSSFDLDSYEIRPCLPTRLLSHLEEIDLGGRRLTVHHTPGETPGAVCLFDEGNGMLFTGDTFYPGTLWAHQEESDFDAFGSSLRYLAGLPGVRRLCPAHNEASVPGEMLRAAADAFDLIAAGSVPYEPREGTRLYRFDGFAVSLKRDDTP
jgi:glyoxylase-like metal-dependent hydrolase (beta-lactamase superfamily II)